MKKWINLQLFAEDAPDGGNDTGGAPAAKEPAPEATVEPKGEKKYTEEDVDNIVKRRKAEWQKQQEKAVSEAKKLAEMNAQQKAEYERDQYKKELEELQRTASLAEMAKTARKMLADEGIVIGDDLLSRIVGDDAETTKAAVDEFAKLFTDAVESAVKERLKGEPPRKGSGGAPAMTKEQIMAIKDPELRQRKMLEHRELFNI